MSLSAERASKCGRDKNGQAFPEDQHERFEDAKEEELRKWIFAAIRATAVGPSTWHGYTATLAADPALRAAASGGFARLTMIQKPGLYDTSTASAAE